MDFESEEADRRMERLEVVLAWRVRPLIYRGYGTMGADHPV